MKEKQNVTTFNYGNYSVETTMTRVIVYQGKSKVGEAQVRNAKDFDFQTLFKLAIHESGSQIMVA